MFSTFSYCLGTAAANFLQIIMVIIQVNMLTHNRIGVGGILVSMTYLCHPKMSPVHQQICLSFFNLMHLGLYKMRNVSKFCM